MMSYNIAALKMEGESRRMSLSFLYAHWTTSDVVLGRHHEDMADLGHYVSLRVDIFSKECYTILFGSHCILRFGAISPTPILPTQPKTVSK